MPNVLNLDIKRDLINNGIVEAINDTIEKSLKDTLQSVDYKSEHLKSNPKLLEKESEIREILIDSIESIKTDYSIKMLKLASAVSRRCQAVVRRYQNEQDRIYIEDISKKKD